MITQPVKKPLKHKSEKAIINRLYSKFGNDIHSLINQEGNLFDMVLEVGADFEHISEFVIKYANDQLNKFDDEKAYVDGDGFSSIWITQIGNNKKNVVSVNAKHIKYELEYNGQTRIFNVFKLRNSQDFFVYKDFGYMEVLRKQKGSWFMHIFTELAEKLGKIIDNDKNWQDTDKGK